MEITLYNDFHDIEVTLRVKDGQCLSRSQYRKVQRELCGHDDCTCGTVRGPQDVVVDSTQERDPVTGFWYHTYRIMEG